MKIAIVGPPSRVSGSTKITYKQAVSLAARNHQIKLVFQKRGLDKMTNVYTGLTTTDSLELLPLAPNRILTPLINFLTRRYRRMHAGAHLPVSDSIWYRNGRLRQLADHSARNGTGVVTEIDLDVGALFWAMPRLSRNLVSWDCSGLLFYATPFALPVMPIFNNQSVRKVLYLLDMPVAKTLTTEGRPSNSPFVRFVRRFETWVIRHTDALACMNHLVQADWSETYGIRPQIIPPGCTPLNRLSSDKSDLVLTVTHWYPDKRPFYFLELAKLLRTSKLRLAMAGHWPNPRDLQEMRDQIKRNGLEQKLLLFPDCPEDQLMSLYRSARCFVAPPKGGGYMMGALESAAVGTPIVYPKATGAWDVFSPGVHGFAPNVEDIDDVLSCIIHFEDNALVERMSVEIWTRAKELSWDNHCSALEALLA